MGATKQVLKLEYLVQDRIRATTSNHDDQFKQETVVSRGTVGHPFTCGPPCKYAKKRLGCKERHACDHCHLCVWSRYAKCTPKKLESSRMTMALPHGDNA